MRRRLTFSHRKIPYTSPHFLGVIGLSGMSILILCGDAPGLSYTHKVEGQVSLAGAKPGRDLAPEGIKITAEQIKEVRNAISKGESVIQLNVREHDGKSFKIDVKTEQIVPLNSGNSRNKLRVEKPAVSNPSKPLPASCSIYQATDLLAQGIPVRNRTVPLNTGAESRSPASPPSTTDPLSLIQDIASNVPASELLRGAELAHASNEHHSQDDQKHVAEAYRSSSPSELQARLEQAHESLNEAANAMDSPTLTALDPGDKARFKNMYLNAADKAQIAAQTLRASRTPAGLPALAVPSENPLTQFLSQGAQNTSLPNALSTVKNMLGLGGSDVKSDSIPAKANSNDGLVNRQILFHGLPQDQANQVAAKLHFAEPLQVPFGEGKTQAIKLLHNGYLFGSLKTGMDCSSFVSSLLPADVRKTKFTTLDFRVMWLYARTGTFPQEGQYSRERRELIKQTSSAFIPINLEMGDHLGPGDILVYRMPSVLDGHVFIVKQYHPESLTVDTIEASQSAGTLRERTVQLSVDPITAPVRFFRPGYFALRLKPVDNRACMYKETKKVGL